MGILTRFFRRRDTSSRAIAKERLQLVLVHDRVQLSPGMLERMKDELITVISRYVEIDEAQVQVALTRGKRESRLVADIPVVGPAVATGSTAARTGAGGDGSTLVAQL